MQRPRNGNRQQLGDSVALSGEINISQTIHHKHTENGPGQRLSEIFDIFRRGLFAGKDRKWQKTGEHGSGGAKADCHNLLKNRHKSDPPLSMGFLKSVRKTSTQIMVGTIKPSAPKINRHKTDEKIPIYALK